MRPDANFYFYSTINVVKQKVAVALQNGRPGFIDDWYGEWTSIRQPLVEERSTTCGLENMIERQYPNKAKTGHWIEYLDSEGVREMDILAKKVQRNKLTSLKT